MKQHTWRLLDSAIFETLEGREMQSATPMGSVSFTGGVLTLDAAPKQSTQMTVNFYKKNASQLVARSGDSVKKVAASQVKQIVINGGSASENIHIDPAIKAPATVNIGTGNAGVQAGTGDTINAGTGRTAIHLKGGNNVVHLGSGTGVVQTSTVGNDVIYAGTGKAIVNGSMSRGSVVGANSKMKLVNAGNFNVTRNTTTSTTHTPTTGQSNQKSGQSNPGTTTTPTTNTTTSTSTSTSTNPSTTPTTTTGKSGITAVVTSTDAAAPQPAITMVAGTHQAGLAVNVSGLTSVLGAGDALGATYAWDFGDPSGAHNQIVGVAAGHIYDTPGTYTITLTLTNANGVSATTTQQVMIAASTRTAVYVDSVGGSDSNNGSASAPFQTLAKAMSNIGNNTEVLLKAGDTFTVDAALNINASNVLVGKYGTGADPILSRVKGNGIGTIYTNPASNGITFENLHFDSPYGVADGQAAPKNGVSGIYIGGSNIAVRNCTFGNVDDAINENAGPTGVLVMDNSAPLATGLRGYFLWGVGSQTTIVGNTVAGSTKEHNIRMYGWNQFTIVGNNLTNHDGKGGIEMQYGAYGYVADNTLNGGEMRTGPLGEWGEPTADTTSWVVIKDNTLNNTFMNFEPGSQHVLFDNNVVKQNNAPAIDLHGSNAYTSLDIQIKHNTGIDTGTMGSFLSVNGALNGVILQNNAWVAPNIIPGGYNTAAVEVKMSSLSDFTSIADNIWPSPTHLYAYANGGVNYVAAQTDGYVTNDQWNSFSQVHDDQFVNVAPTDLTGTYQLTAGPITAGSSMALAA